jgi:CheY-like chemotaxis protein
MMTDQDNTSPENTSAGRVTALMVKKGIQPRERAGIISDILGVAFSTAHRKLKGENRLSVDELRTIAKHFEVSVSELVSEDAEAPAGDPAQFIVGGKQLPCTLWLGDALPATGRMPELVAIQVNGEWRVVEAARAQSEKRFAVTRVEMAFEAPSTPTFSIAVVDDDSLFCESLAEYFETQDLSATAYSDPEVFIEALQRETFDGFVVDWNLGEYTGQDLMRAIRDSSSQSAPLILLTGMLHDPLQNSEKSSAQVASAINEKQNAIYMGKPVDNELISSTLRNMIKMYLATR